ncbi:MAG: ribonuclease P protein component [Lachnospiraceae bacterium]|nr:ribonuclease P protein component [Lachnospiraceae bacterium]
MKYSDRLRKNRDFQSVYKGGTSKANKYLVMYVKENNTDENRIGVSVSKKVGNSVVRHHLARLIREGYRLQEELFRRGLDVVVIARVNAKDCTYHEIERAIYHLGSLHQIIREKENDEEVIN